MPQSLSQSRADPADGPMAAAAAPLQLPRLVMRGAVTVAALVLAAALLLGLMRARQDIADEVDAAMALAGVVARLAQPAQGDDAAVLAALQVAQRAQPLRHLLLRVRAADGRLLLGPADNDNTGGAMVLLHRWLVPADVAALRTVQWPLSRPGGGTWTVSLAASPESELRESLLNLGGMLALLLACVAGLLLAMQANLRRAFAPLGRLLAAIEGIAGSEGHDTRAVQALPKMPFHELEAVAAALRHLGSALDAAEAQRRALSRQMLTLQEDERTRLARELHDEFGQRLTALRADAAWLARRTADQPALLAVADGISAHGQQIQQDIRVLLARLQPFGPVGAADEAARPLDDSEPGEALSHLVALLEGLVAGWAPRLQASGTALSLRVRWLGGPRPKGWAQAPATVTALRLPRPLALTVYRISQESLTNIARHAQATRAVLNLDVHGQPVPDAMPGPGRGATLLRLDWWVEDDGIGLGPAADAGDAARRRGNGLAGLRERVWAQGADLRMGPAVQDAERPGLRLAASFDGVEPVGLPPA